MVIHHCVYGNDDALVELIRVDSIHEVDFLCWHDIDDHGPMVLNIFFVLLYQDDETIERVLCTSTVTAANSIGVFPMLFLIEQLRVLVICFFIVVFCFVFKFL